MSLSHRKGRPWSGPKVIIFLRSVDLKNGGYVKPYYSHAGLTGLSIKRYTQDVLPLAS